MNETNTLYINLSIKSCNFNRDRYTKIPGHLNVCLNCSWSAEKGDDATIHVVFAVVLSTRWWIVVDCNIRKHFLVCERPFQTVKVIWHFYSTHAATSNTCTFFKVFVLKQHPHFLSSKLKYKVLWCCSFKKTDQM